jgi:galactokinase
MSSISPSPADGGRGALSAGVPLDQLVQRLQQRFRDVYGRPPRWLAAAPGRVNLIGEHTDYNQGFVLPMAIERYVVVAADRAGADGVLRVQSDSVHESVQFSLADRERPQTPHWSNYVRGVVAGCVSRGLDPGALDVLIDSNVPLGAGLSSSAAIEVATATLLEAVTAQTLEPVAKALVCQQAEHGYAGVPCGIMDQFTSVMGRPDHLLLIDCRSTEVEMVPLTDPDVTVLIANSNVKHELTGGEYAERRGQCARAADLMGMASLRDASRSHLEQWHPKLGPVLYRRARHVIGEIQRTTQAAAALTAGDWDQVGQLMYASHESLRRDYEVSCDELDALVDLARQLGETGGVIGARMTGGGFGGCTVSLVASDAVASVAAAIQQGYQQRTGIAPTIFTSRPARGAHVVRGG